MGIVRQLDKPLKATNGQIATESEDGRPVWARNEKGIPICGAMSRKGSHCRTFNLCDNGRCRMHGGKGSGAPIKHGRFSKFLPERLAGIAEEAYEDPALISMRDQMAVLDAMWKDHASRLGESSSAEQWKTARRKMAKLQAAVKTGHAHDVKITIAELAAILENGQGEQQTEERMRSVFRDQVRVARQEVHRLDKMAQFITAQQGNAMMAQVLAILNRRVLDADLRSQIGKDIRDLASRRAG